VRAFTEIAAGVHVLRYPVLDVNLTLVVGDETALLVDTLSTEAQARALLAAVRQVTPLPLCVVNTHHHFDHTFGNMVFAEQGAPIYAHAETVELLRSRGEELRRHWYAEWCTEEPELKGMLTVPIRLPDRTVVARSTVELGGRSAELRHFGRGHSAGDLLVHVPDADVVVAGDLVEQSGPPQFSDAYPLEWPDALAGLLSLTGEATKVIPGHGEVVGPGFVREQHDQLTALDWLIREGDADNAPASRVAEKAPLPTTVALVAVRRGYDHLAGRG
jgi:glyoxylase-like metal-dependent hydrolase (beta-lactamase superfamily II)